MLARAVLGALAVYMWVHGAAWTGIQGGYTGCTTQPPTHCARRSPEEARERSDRTPQCGVAGGRGPGVTPAAGDGGGTASGPPFGPGQVPAGPSLSRTLRMPPPGLYGEI